MARLRRHLLLLLVCLSLAFDLLLFQRISHSLKRAVDGLLDLAIFVHLRDLNSYSFQLFVLGRLFL